MTDVGWGEGTVGKVLGTKPEDLSLIPRNRTGTGEKQLLKAVLWPSWVFHGINVPTHRHTTEING